MVELAEIASAEERYRNGEPSLGEAYNLLLQRWREGGRDLETGLRLMFLAWYSLAEPTWLTGLSANGTMGVFDEVFDYFGGTQTKEPEMLTAVALMTKVGAWCCGNEYHWTTIGEMCEKLGPKLGAELAPEHFSGRGAYGHYFEHQARSFLK